MEEAKEILEQLSREDLISLLGKTLGRGDRQENKISIEKLCEKHREYAKAREFSEATLKNYDKAYHYLQEYTTKRGLTYADEFTYDHADEFFNYLQRHPGMRQQGKLSRCYIISNYKLIKAVFAYAERRGYIIRNRFENKVFPQSQIKEWWTDDYMEKLIKAIKEHAKPCTRIATELKIRLTYTTGLRSGIIHGIRRQDVIIKGDEIFVSTKCKVPKSAAIQRVTTPILNEKAKEMLRDYTTELDKKGIAPSEYIFANESPRTGYCSYRKTLVQVCKKAGIPYIRPHGAKHGFITKLAQAGMSAEQICKATGNLTPSLIQKVYMHLNIGDISSKLKGLIGDI